MKCIYIIFSCFLLLCTSCGNNNSNGRKNYNNFSHPKEYAHSDNVVLQTGWYYVLDPGNGVKRKKEKSDKIFYIGDRPFIGVKHFASIQINKVAYDNNNFSEITTQLDEKGTQKFDEVTAKSSGRKIAFVVADKLLSVAQVQGEIKTGRVSISLQGYTKDELESMTAKFEKEKVK